MQKLANFLIAFGLCLCLPDLLMAQPVRSAFHPNQLLIRFQPSTPVSDINQLLAYYNAVQLDSTPISEVRLWEVLAFPIPGTTFTNINEVIANANTQPQVTGVGLNYQTEVVPSRNAIVSSPWGENGVCNYNLVCSSSTQFTNVVIMDTGTSYDCPDLAGRFVADAPGYDFVHNDNQPYDDHGHGTHMAGLIDQVIRLNPTERIRFFAYKTHDQTGKGELFDVIKAVDRAIQEQMHIINMSFAYYPASSEKPQDVFFTPKPPPLQAAIDIAGQYGILVLASAGNDSQNNDKANLPALPSSFTSQNIISIASGNCSKQLSSFSNWGPKSVDIVSPGENLAATGLECNLIVRSGTSQATAITTGVAAVLGTHFNGEPFNYQRVKCAILSGVELVSPLTTKVSSQGVINAPGALQSFQSSSCDIDGGIKSKRIPANTLSLAPNPFSGTLSVRFKAERTEQAQLSIWDAQGKQVFAQNWTVEPGPQEISWEPAGQTPGVYTVRVLLGEATYTSKAVLLR